MLVVNYDPTLPYTQVKYAMDVVKEEMLDVLRASPKNYDIDQIISSNTIHSFDQNFTCKMFGFQCTSDLHRFSSSGRKA